LALAPCLPDAVEHIHPPPPMSNNAETVAVNQLFIDKEKQKVLFAESDKEFVDVLFSFLTLPLGSIVRLLGKQSGVGCPDEVYKSVSCFYKYRVFPAGQVWAT
jgi:hypothetical protein